MLSTIKALISWLDVFACNLIPFLHHKYFDVFARHYKLALPIPSRLHTLKKLAHGDLQSWLIQNWFGYRKKCCIKIYMGGVLKFKYL